MKISSDRDCERCELPLWEHEQDLCYWCQGGHDAGCLAPITDECLCKED